MSTLTPSEQRDVEQALAVGDRINEFVVSSNIKVHARIQFIAHIIAALGLARANNVDYRTVMSTVRKMHAEMNRTERETRARAKPKLKLVTKGLSQAVEEMVRAQNERNNAEEE